MIKGFAPKPDDERTRRNAPIFSRLPVQWDGVVRGPVLPKHREWSKWTKEWYEDFRRTPQSMICTETDWHFIADTALLYELMWTPKTPAAQVVTLSGEFRRRMSSYGYTFEDRLKMRMEIRSPQKDMADEAQIDAAASEMVNYAEMLNAKVANKKKT